ncbi:MULTISPECIES: hypothetical protein [unclassified Polaribacter]|uniref:hypothetical protein n=1 Tax=unclassified Polaribacter TaxID=196858 RepID=UPI0011BE7A1B|nr:MULTISPECIES: hypothetical protein [unclassified Polaribacter]TXD50862.1 hypothetical protein ES043_14420 [Polaribacter sp. IC063]TXD57687.1 hypothetical protein ES044_14425 [Polaribacter sp. IC066]
MIKYLFPLILIFVMTTNKSVCQSKIIELVQNRISLDNLKSKLKSADFVKEPLSKYGIDSENYGLTLMKNGKEVFFIWSKQNEKEIAEIIISDKSISIDNLCVGKTFNDFLKINPNSVIELDALNSEYEYSVSKNGDYIVEFIYEKTKIGEYNNDFKVKRVLNKEVKIDRIRISKNE